MHALSTRRVLGQVAALCLGAVLAGCPADDDPGPENDVGLPADMGPDAAPDRGPDGKDAGPDDATPADATPADAEPTEDAAAPDVTPPDAAPAAEEARAPELCVGCGAAASPRFRLIEHGLTPVPQGPTQTATSPRFRLILEP